MHIVETVQEVKLTYWAVFLRFRIE